ncbi:energy transducer TonB [Flavobacterium sp.]|uniref:energy transducer TonB n=1 Tax=Flavobacterium sp. TaxID=239 RepID=UPI002A80214A|nr:energy transducer TonB [Flavobacterium sp.]
MRVIIPIIFFLFTFSIFAQDFSNPKSVPTFFGSDQSSFTGIKKKDIVFKTLEFISKKTDSLFLKRMKLKENDSIEFQISYIIDAYGYIENDSTIINTPITSFNNYMKLIINMLPRFTPAINDNNETIPYKIEFTGKFNVKSKKLNHFQYEVNEYFLADIDIVPIFPGCEGAKDAIDCFNQKMMEHININFNYPQEAQKKNIQGRVSIQFIVDEFGNVNDIKTRGPMGGELLEKEAHRIMSLLPKFTPGYQKGKAVKVKYGIPINFRLQ